MSLSKTTCDEFLQKLGFAAARQVSTPVDAVPNLVPISRSILATAFEQLSTSSKQDIIQHLQNAPSVIDAHGLGMNKEEELLAACKQMKMTKDEFINCAVQAQVFHVLNPGSRFLAGMFESVGRVIQGKPAIDMPVFKRKSKKRPRK